jgi:hypothetical protein
LEAFSSVGDAFTTLRAGAYFLGETDFLGEADFLHGDFFSCLILLGDNASAFSIKAILFHSAEVISSSYATSFLVFKAYFFETGDFEIFTGIAFGATILEGAGDFFSVFAGDFFSAFAGAAGFTTTGAVTGRAPRVFLGSIFGRGALVLASFFICFGADAFLIGVIFFGVTTLTGLTGVTDL